MKFVVSSSELLSHLSAISKVIGSKNTLPILDNYLFQLEEGKLVITASDLESTLITSIKLDSTEGEGVIAVPAKLLNDMLKEFPDQPLTFKVDLDKFAIELFSENGKFNIVGLDGEEFPQLPEVASEATELQIPAEVLLSGISRTVFATADDELRPVMNGILFEIDGSELTFVASDSHKLIRYRRSGLNESEKSSFILPKKPSNLLKGLLPKEDLDVSLTYDGRNAIFKLSKHTLICRLVEGAYPAYATVIPKESPNVLYVDRQVLYNTVKRVSVFASESSNLIKMSVEGNQLVLSAEDVDFVRSAVEKISCQYEGEDVQIGFKSTFLLEILSNIDSVEVKVELSDSSRAGLFLPAEKTIEEEDILMLLMPMMLGA